MVNEPRRVEMPVDKRQGTIEIINITPLSRLIQLVGGHCEAKLNLCHRTSWVSQPNYYYNDLLCNES
jgi:hypothetical protein